MRGYPKGLVTKKDYENLLVMPEYSGQAKADLASLSKIDDSKIIIDEGTQEAPKLKEITNPLPIWKRVGFRSKDELVLVSAAAAEDIVEIEKA